MVLLIRLLLSHLTPDLKDNIRVPHSSSRGLNQFELQFKMRKISNLKHAIQPSNLGTSQVY